MALDFAGGNSDHVEIAADASIDNMAEWTYAMWIYTDNSTASQQNYYTKGASGSARIGLERKYGDPNDFDLVIDTSGNAVVYTTNNVNKPLNKWFFVAATFNGSVGSSGNAAVYTAPFGEMATEASYAGSPQLGTGTVTPDDGDSLILGNYFSPATSNGSMYGRMAHFHVLDKSLSLAEIQAIQYSGRMHQNTKVFMHLGLEGTGTQKDLSGYGNNGSVTGAGVAEHAPLALGPRAKILQFPVISSPATITGTPQLQPLTAAGSVDVFDVSTVNGTPQLQSLAGAGGITLISKITGTPQLQPLTAAGAVDVFDVSTISGTPQLQNLAGSGGITLISKITGTPQLQTLTAAGAVDVFGVSTVSGTPQLQALTAAGSITLTSKITGTPQLQSLVAAGVVDVFSVATVNGDGQLQNITASGSIQVGDVTLINGSPQLQTLTAAGSVDVFDVSTVSGTPQLQTLTGAGAVDVFDVSTVSGTPQLQSLAGTGSIILISKITGTPQLQPLTAAGFMGVPAEIVQIIGEAVAINTLMEGAQTIETILADSQTIDRVIYQEGKLS